MLTFQIKLPAGKDRISELSPLIQANVFAAFQAGMELAADRSRTEYLSGPYPEKLAVESGMLRSRVRGRVEKGSGGVFATGILGVSGGLIYSWIHELGGIITPKTKKALHFFWKRKQIWMTLQRVNMPAKPYLRPAILDELPRIQNLIDMAVIKSAQNVKS